MTYLILFFIIILALIVTSKILGVFYVPPFLAMVIAGMYFGPQGLNFLNIFLVAVTEPEKLSQINDAIQIMSMVGAILMMIILGLETRLTTIGSHKREVTLFTIFSMALPVLGAIGTAWYLALDIPGTLILAALFSSHSIGVAFHEIKVPSFEHTRLGKIILGSTMINNCILLIILAVALFMKQQSGNMLIQNNLSIFNRLVFTSQPALALGVFIPALLLFCLFSFFVFPGFIKTLKQKMPGLRLSSMFNFLFIMLIFLFLGSFLGINIIVGAFFAGVSLAVTELTASEKIEKTYNLLGYRIFLPFLFFFIGTETQVTNLFQMMNLIPFLIILIAMTGTKFLGGYIGLKVTGFNNLKSVSGGLLTLPKMAVTFVIAYFGKAAGIISGDIYTMIILLSLIFGVIIPLIINHMIRLKLIRVELTSFEPEPFRIDKNSVI